MDSCFRSFLVTERSLVAYAKREIRMRVEEEGFTKGRQGEIDIIVSELGTNLIKHGGGGELLMRINRDPAGDNCFELISIDNGAGMIDTSKMMKDGVSTSNSLGQGMGAMQRLSDEFQVFSIPDWGTIVYCLVRSAKLVGGLVSKLDVKGICIPKPQETVCGDGYVVRRTRQDVRIFFGDGLGHGVHAYEAVRSAADFFSQSDENDPIDLIRQIHEKVRKSRGLVGSIAILDLKSSTWKIGGVGNITTRIYKGTEYKTHMAYNGAIGLNIPNTMTSSILPAEKGQRLVMCSDGLKSSWNILKYGSLMRYDGTVQAAALYKDFSRRLDDASVLVATVN